MQGPDGQLGEGGVDQQRELDLGRGDGADVDPAVGERAERLGGDAGVAAHADADDRYLGDIGRAVDPLIADVVARLVDGGPCALVVSGRDREGEVGGGAVGG